MQTKPTTIYTYEKYSAKSGEDGGFSLVEVVVAMSVFLIVLLAISSVLVYSINFNAGNNTRTQALMILQQEVEQLRGLKFTPLTTHPELAGGVHAEKPVTTADNGRFSIVTTVDDNPELAGMQIDAGRTLKEITVTVRLDRPTPGWQTALPATTVFRRARSN